MMDQFSFRDSTLFLASCLRSLLMRRRRHSVIIHQRTMMKCTLPRLTLCSALQRHHTQIPTVIWVMALMLEIFMAHGPTLHLSSHLFGLINGDFPMHPIDTYVDKWRKKTKKRERQLGRNTTILSG